VADAAVRKPTTSRAAKRPQRARLLVDERRAQLLALGIKLFAERSYDEVSIDELARAANISKGLLYHYFPTKRDLYTAALRQAAQQLLDETQPLACLPQDERARRGLETYLAFADRHGPAYVALMRGGLGADREIVGILEATRGTIAQRILDALPTGIATPLIRAAVRGWIGFVEATALDWLAHKQVDRDRLVELLLGLLFDAIARAAVAG
jgi:AcrR family transcriptional regulator